MLRKHNEQGSALLLAIIITMILLVLGGALASFSLIEKGQVGRDEGDLKAYYIARSGADLVAQAVLENEDDFEDIKGKTTKPVTLGQGSFTAKIEPISSGARIVSTGVVGNRKRTVSLVLEGVSSIPSIDHAIYAKGKLDMYEGVAIAGDVATSSSDRPSITMKGGTSINGEPSSGHSGTVFVPTNVPDEYIEDSVDRNGNVIEGGIVKKDIPQYNDINFPDTPSITLNTSPLPNPLVFSGTDKMHFGEVTINGGGGGNKFIIDLKGKDCTLVIDHLVGEQWANIEVINPGHLDLYVNKISVEAYNGLFINLDGSGTGDQNVLRGRMAAANEDMVTLYYTGNEPFGANNSDGTGNWRFMIAGTLVTDKADIFLHQDSIIKGNILTNATKIDIGNNGLVNSGLIYAPNAKVKLGNGAETGAIVCDTFTSSGGPSAQRPYNVKFEPIDPDKIPAGILPGDSSIVSNLARSYWER